jgi:hypothetical protein
MTVSIQNLKDGNGLWAGFIHQVILPSRNKIFKLYYKPSTKSKYRTNASFASQLLLVTGLF